MLWGLTKHGIRGRPRGKIHRRRPYPERGLNESIGGITDHHGVRFSCALYMVRRGRQEGSATPQSVCSPKTYAVEEIIATNPAILDQI